jgi:hypothetical protein
MIPKGQRTTKSDLIKIGANVSKPVANHCAFLLLCILGVVSPVDMVGQQPQSTVQQGHMGGGVATHCGGDDLVSRQTIKGQQLAKACFGLHVWWVAH